MNNFKWGDKIRYSDFSLGIKDNEFIIIYIHDTPMEKK